MSPNNGLPNPPSFGGRAINLLLSVRLTTPSVIAGKNLVFVRSSIILIILLMFGRVCV